VSARGIEPRRDTPPQHRDDSESSESGIDGSLVVIAEPLIHNSTGYSQKEEIDPSFGLGLTAPRSRESTARLLPRVNEGECPRAAPGNARSGSGSALP